MIALPAAYCLAFGPPPALSEAAAFTVDLAVGTLRAISGAASGASLVSAAAAAGLAALAAASAAPPVHAATVCLVAALVFSGAEAGPCMATSQIASLPLEAATSGTVMAPASATLLSALVQVLPQEPASRLWLGVVAAAAAQSAALLTIISRWDWEEQAKQATFRKVTSH